MSLEMNAACQSRDAVVTPDGAVAICCTECTFRPDCAESRLRRVRPNCGGEPVSRPRRVAR